MINKQHFFAGLLGFVLCACSQASIDEGVVPTDVTVYFVEDIPHQQINFIWIELPLELDPGENDVRVFMARTDPPGMLVPTETELPCIIQSEEEYLDLRPLTLPFVVDGAQIVGSYSWMACASCVECYMNWETTMEIVGTIEQNKMELSVGIRHMGHNIQDDYVQLKLLQEEPSSKEPRIECRRASDCLDIEFVPRQ